MTQPNTLSPDLIFLKEQVYDPCGFVWFNFQRHTESREYDACSFALNGKNIQYRAAKITPTKVGSLSRSGNATPKALPLLSTFRTNWISFASP